MEWFPHPLPAYTRHWTTFICCGWAHGSIIMPLPTHVSTQMLEVPWNSTSLLGDKGWHCAVVEALTQYGVDPTSPPNIWKVFDNFHMLLMGTWNLHHVTTTTCVRPDVGSGIILHHSWATKDTIVQWLRLTKDGRNPTSPPNIWKVFENLHMLWMGTWIYHNAVITTCINPDLGS
jgi:hypothetical protein